MLSAAKRICRYILTVNFERNFVTSVCFCLQHKDIAAFTEMSRTKSEDADVFNKLSRILSTHETVATKDDPHMEVLANALDLSSSPGRKTSKGKNAKTDPMISLPDRPTPFEVWQARQGKKDASSGQGSKGPSSSKLTSTQVNKMIQKMHMTNRIKHDETVRVQNEGLKQELAGFEFKPHINKTSKDLAATMKPIAERMPEMVAEKERMLARKREEREKEIMASCAFQPTRIGAKTSDKYLRKMGRSAKARPEDFFAYHEEKLKRNEQRRQIIDSIESRELVFTPQLPESSRRIQENMLTNPANKTVYDPVSRTTTVIRSPRRVIRRNENGELVDHQDSSHLSGHAYGRPDSDEHDVLVEGPPLMLESDHPYKHNLNEYTSVAVPGAVSYNITFDEQTATEPVADYVRFLKFDDQNVVYGASKYTGGMIDPKGPRSNATQASRTSCNWPGVGQREALVIKASKFVVHFKTNGAINDWGFRMHIVPIISSQAASQEPQYRDETFRPKISSKGHSYAGSSSSKNVPIHERLYEHALKKMEDDHNKFVQVLSDKVQGVDLKPWEGFRSQTGDVAPWVVQNRTHVGKNLLGPALNDLLILEGDQRTVAVAETGTADLASIWRIIQGAKPLRENTNENATESQDFNHQSLSFSRMRISDL